MCQKEIAEQLPTGDSSWVDFEITGELNMDLMFGLPTDMENLTVQDPFEELATSFPFLTPEEMLNALPDLTPEQQRNLLGENLYPRVHMLERENAARVTGMILELPHSEIIRLFHSPDALKEIVDQAMEVLRKSQQENSSATNSDSVSSDNTPVS